jgi:hypothetical protein
MTPGHVKSLLLIEDFKELPSFWPTDIATYAASLHQPKIKIAVEYGREACLQEEGGGEAGGGEGSLVVESNKQRKTRPLLWSSVLFMIRPGVGSAALYYVLFLAAPGVLKPNGSKIGSELQFFRCVVTHDSKMLRERKRTYSRKDWMKRYLLYVGSLVGSRCIEHPYYRHRRTN